jgi:large subunit ribosomal protein L24
MKKNFLKTGDQVKIITGSKKGSLGKIVRLVPKHELACLSFRIVEDEKKEGEISRKKEKGDLCIHVSNLMLYDSEAALGSRIGYKVIENKKYRYFKASGKLLPKVWKKESFLGNRQT